jgi:hypothetical protein
LSSATGKVRPSLRTPAATLDGTCSKPLRPLPVTRWGKR